MVLPVEQTNMPEPACATLCNNPPMLQLNPKDPGDTPFRLQRALKESGLSLQQVRDRMHTDYGEELTPSTMSRSFTRGTLSLQRALQILAICGVSEVETKLTRRLTKPEQVSQNTDYTNLQEAL